MNNRMCILRKQTGGFSLTEMLIATGIMAIGLVMIATIFPVAMKLTGLSAERSMAAVAADEAFAKVQLYGLRDFVDWPAAQLNPTMAGTPDPDATYDFCDDFIFVTEVLVGPGVDTFWGTDDDVYTSPGPDENYFTAGDNVLIDLGDELLYPSINITPPERHKYHWSALCRRVDENDVQVTVFVTRRSFAGIYYYGFFHNRTGSLTNPSQVYGNTSTWPTPIPANVQYNVSGVASPPLRELVIDVTDPVNTDWDNALGVTGTAFSFFDEGYKIVNDRDGKIYRIFEMRDTDGDGVRETIVLWEDWQWDGYESAPLTPPASVVTETVWVVPPGVNSGRYPCVGLFQKVIRFDEIE